MIRRIVLICLLIVTALWLCGCQLSAYLPFRPAPTEAPIIVPLPLPGYLVSLSFSESSSYFARVQGYDFCNEDNKYTVYFWLANEDEPYPVPVDEAWVDKLTDIVQGYNVIRWDGFRGTDSMLMDGTSFSISLTFSDGTTVYASGYGRFPDGYGRAKEEIDAHFMQLLPEDMREW